MARTMRTACATWALLALAACGGKSPPGFQGYAEGEFVLVAAPAAGKLEKRWGQRGQEVAAGRPPFPAQGPEGKTRGHGNPEGPAQGHAQAAHNPPRQT